MFHFWAKRLFNCLFCAVSYLIYFYFDVKWLRCCYNSFFSVCHINIRSILATSDGGPSRFDLLQEFITKENKFDVIALTETHIDANIDSSLITIENYDLFRKDRNRSGGGVALYVKSIFFPKLLLERNKFNIESLFVKCQIDKKMCNSWSLL